MHCHNYLFINFIDDNLAIITIIVVMEVFIERAMEATIKLIIEVIRTISTFNFIIWIIIP